MKNILSIFRGFVAVGIFSTVLIVLFSTFSLANEPTAYKIGDKITFDNVKNQFEKDYKILANTKIIIISSSKSTGKILTAYLNNNTNYQNKTNTRIYIDIYSIPSFIFNTFMINKIQKRKYSLGLINDEKIHNKILAKDEHFTIFHLNNNIITKIEFTKDIK
jgi:disulfide oxidoreductase YuzD